MLFKRMDIQAGVAEWRRSPGAILLDVREADEYASGHIPGAKNVPLSTIDRFAMAKDTPLFVYCLRGSRSKRAVAFLKKQGYANVRSIGGIKGYKGEIER